MGSKHLLGLVLGLFLTITTGFAASDKVELNPNHPTSYTVKKGDTLWDLAEMFITDPWRWPDIWHVNPQIENPHLIYPGDVLSLTYKDGRPILGLRRGKQTVKLSPHVRESRLEDAIPAIPLKAIAPFLTRPLIVTDAEYEGAPYIVAPEDEHVMAATNDKVYVRGINNQDATRYSIMRKGETYVNPEDPKDILGYEAIFVADAEAARFGDPTTFVIIDSNREALRGDRLFASDSGSVDTHFMPHAPGDVSGVILAVHDGVSQIGTYNVISINLGKREGLEPGHVLEIWKAGATIKDLVTEDRKDEVTLPDEAAGQAMVFRTFERVSYALVMKASTNITVMDKVKTPR